MKASVRLILAVCCVYTVLSGFPRGEGLSDELSLCAVALNHSVNTSNTSDYFSLSKCTCIYHRYDSALPCQGGCCARVFHRTSVPLNDHHHATRPSQPVCFSVFKRMYN